ncbi:MAG: deoxyribonuclease V [Gemmataceae bacterium]
MDIPPLHSWDLTPKEAVALQRELAGRVAAKPALKRYRYVGGVDASYTRFSPVCQAAIAVWDAKTGEVAQIVGVCSETRFPYVPGLLSFREIPPLLEAFAKLDKAPDVVMVDGHGYAHPRRFGIACHLGLLLDLPTIGCAKSRLVGSFTPPAPEAGSTAPLVDKDELIGLVLRSKTRTNPLFISVGHRIDLESAARVTLECSRGYRMPEPTRQAHLAVNEIRRGERPA